jgi:hypothetical protein
MPPPGCLPARDGGERVEEEGGNGGDECGVEYHHKGTIRDGWEEDEEDIYAEWSTT